jgi:hypothetical protein
MVTTVSVTCSGYRPRTVARATSSGAAQSSNAAAPGVCGGHPVGPNAIPPSLRKTPILNKILGRTPRFCKGFWVLGKARGRARRALKRGGSRAVRMPVVGQLRTVDSGTRIVDNLCHRLMVADGYKLANDGHDTRAIQHNLGHRNIRRGSKSAVPGLHRKPTAPCSQRESVFRVEY